MFFDRLQEACKMRNTAPTTVIHAIACSAGMIDGWKKGSSPRSDIVVKLADCLNVSADYLLERTDDPSPIPANARVLDNDEILLIDGLRTINPPQRYMVYKMVAAALPREEEVAVSASVFLPPKDGIPHHSRDVVKSRATGQGRKRVEGSAAAGIPITAAPEDDMTITVPAKYLSDDYFIVRAKGDSMIDYDINDGDYCVFRRDAYLDNGNVMLVHVEGVTDQSDVTIKRVFFHGQDVELRSENPNYEPMFYPADEVRITGVLVAVFPSDS